MEHAEWAALSAEEKAAQKQRSLDAKDYAKRGIELAKAWRVCAKAEAQELEKQLAIRRRVMEQMAPCRKCGLIFANRGELKRHNHAKHHGPNASPYRGVLINSVWAREAQQQ